MGATAKPEGTGPAVSIPADADPPTCPYCGRPFPETRLLALHRGRAHDDELDDDERAAYEAAAAAEAEDLRVYRLQAVGALVCLYFGFLFAYSIVG